MRRCGSGSTDASERTDLVGTDLSLETATWDTDRPWAPPRPGFVGRLHLGHETDVVDPLPVTFAVDGEAVVARVLEHLFRFQSARFLREVGPRDHVTLIARADLHVVRRGLLLETFRRRSGEADGKAGAGRRHADPGRDVLSGRRAREQKNGQRAQSSHRRTDCRRVSPLIGPRIPAGFRSVRSVSSPLRIVRVGFFPAETRTCARHNAPGDPAVASPAR